MQKHEIINLIQALGFQPESSKDIFAQEYSVDSLLKKGSPQKDIYVEKYFTTWPVSKET
jgi:hypothetical protein